VRWLLFNEGVLSWFGFRRERRVILLGI